MPNLLAHTIAFGYQTPTTSGIDTTGANLLIVALSWYASVTVTVSDSVGGHSNMWTPLTVYTNNSGATIGLFYCTPAYVGTGHTFSATHGSGSSIYGTLAVQAWSGMQITGVFQTGKINGANASAASLQPGSITPAGPSLVISAASFFVGTSASVDSSFSISDQLGYLASNRIGGALASLYQPSGIAVNPTWASSGSTSMAATIAAFKVKPLNGAGLLLGVG